MEYLYYFILTASLSLVATLWIIVSANVGDKLGFYKGLAVGFVALTIGLMLWLLLLEAMMGVRHLI